MKRIAFALLLGCASCTQRPEPEEVWNPGEGPGESATTSDRFTFFQFGLTWMTWTRRGSPTFTVDFESLMSTRSARDVESEPVNFTVE